MWRSFLDCGFSELITSGCDSRLTISQDGLNRYGCSARPRDEMAFGSCSCSSPTPFATAAVESFLARLRSTHTPKWIVAESIERVREDLRKFLTLDERVQIALTPSGTDAELLVLALCDTTPGRAITNIVVGPTEVGSGTLGAASGNHYDVMVPRGMRPQKGSAVDQDLADRVRTRTIDIRDERGEIRRPSEVDTEINEVVLEAARNGDKILLHAVAHSKTGIFAPRLQTLDSISKNLGSDVVVMVDGAQGRLGGHFGTIGYGELLNRGFIVSFTGSKFYAGPPFSAAVLVPESLGVAERTRGLPDTFGEYFTRYEMPSAWRAIRSGMDSWINVPALARWVAAKAEMRRFHSIDPAQRGNVLQVFADACQRHFRRSKHLTLKPQFAIRDSDWGAHDAAVYPSVFSFAVELASGSASFEQLKAIHGQSNRAANGVPIRFGQAVRIAPEHAVLRIAASAPMIAQIATDDRLADDLPGRLAFFERQIAQAAERLSHIVSESAHVNANASL